jgi:YggT family protein
MENTGLISIFFDLVRVILRLLSMVLIVNVVISWLFAFDVVSRRNPFVNGLWDFTRRLTDPMLRPLRRLIPPIAGVDLSVLVLLLGITLFESRVTYWLEGLLRGGP